MENQETKQGISAGKIVVVVVLIAIFFGGGVYVYVNNKSRNEKKNPDSQTPASQNQTPSANVTTTPTPAPAPAPTENPPASATAVADTKIYSNSAFGFSFPYPAGATVSELVSTLTNDKGGSEVARVKTSDFTAKIYAAKTGATGAENGSNVIGLYRSHQLSDPSQISKNTTFPAKNFSFSLLDVKADPSYVSAFADLGNTLVDVSFASLNGKSEMTAYTQKDLPQSAKDFLASFSKL